MRPASCKKCMTVVDLDIVPAKESEHGAQARGGENFRAYDQRDFMCPRCGALIEREINGEVVESKGADPRAVKVFVTASDDE